MGPRALKLLRRYIQLVLLQERPEPLKVAIEGMRIWGVLPEQGRGHFFSQLQHAPPAEAVSPPLCRSPQPHVTTSAIARTTQSQGLSSGA